MSDPITHMTATVEGDTGHAAVNRWKTPIVTKVKGRCQVRMTLGANYRKWRTRAARVFRVAAAGRMFEPGALIVHVDAYWPTMHRTGYAAGLPRGDVDAVVKATLDALTHGGVIADDAVVVRAPLAKHYDKDHPRIVIEVARWSGP